MNQLNMIFLKLYKHQCTLQIKWKLTPSGFWNSAFLSEFFEEHVLSITGAWKHGSEFYMLPNVKYLLSSQEELIQVKNKNNNMWVTEVYPGNESGKLFVQVGVGCLFHTENKLPAILKTFYYQNQSLKCPC